VRSCGRRRIALLATCAVSPDATFSDKLAWPPVIANRRPQGSPRQARRHAIHAASCQRLTPAQRIQIILLPRVQPARQRQGYPAQPQWRLDAGGMTSRRNSLWETDVERGVVND